ncbi:MAG TPA: GAF domain-containing sensor histidine kinase [Candidatus Dormibacteraeota bacterium]|nr:GAF domain-containing sensor histidine kinase [Candidatus Dormibacteraeota bacterium]
MVPASSGPHDAVFATGGTDAAVQLIARQEGLQAALEIAQAILAGQEPPTMWQLIASRARRLLQADAAIVRTVGEDGTTLSLRAMDPQRPGDRQPGILLREEPVAASISGAVYEAGRPRIVSDIGALTAAAELLGGAPANVAGRMPAGPALIVPLGPKGYTIGTLMAVNRAGRRSFERRDIDLLRSFAGQAALAVRQAELRRERQRLIVIEERERLARELHDDAVQSLRDITSGLTSAADRTRDPVLRERMAGLVRTVENVIQDLRNHIYGLRPSVLTGRSIEEALRRLVNDFEQQSGTTTTVDVDLDAAERLRDHAGDVVQIVKEALSNVWRHANALNCRVRLGLSGDEAWLLVQDDGVGFDPGRVEHHGHGLRNFRERVERLGGRLEIQSRPDVGTTLRVTIPVAGQDAPS